MIGPTQSIFDAAYYETINTYCFQKQPYPDPDWIWNCSTPGTDTVALIIEGENENLLAGSSGWLNYTLYAPYPYGNVSRNVFVSVVAPYYISGTENQLLCSSPVSFNLENVHQHVHLFYGR